MAYYSIHAAIDERNANTMIIRILILDNYSIVRKETF